jgi:ribosomal protein S10
LFSYTILLQQKQIKEANKEYSDNTRRHQESIRLNALTVLFEEYKDHYEMREEEHRRFIEAKNNTPEGLRLLNEVQVLKNLAFNKKIIVLQELEKAAGLSFNDKAKSAN